MNLPKHEAARIMRYGAGLVRLGLLTSDEFLILHTMLWDLRRLGESTLMPSYADIQRLTRKCRNTIAKALRKFEGFGFLIRKPRWIIVEWGRSKPGGQGRENLRARRTTNLYTFVAHMRQSYSYASVRPTVALELRESNKISDLEKALTRLRGLVLAVEESVRYAQPNYGRANPK